MKDLQQLYHIFILKEAHQQNPSEISSYRKSSGNDVFWHKAELSEFLYQSGFRTKYPGGKSFAVCTTHDIDLLYNHNSLKGNLFWGTWNAVKGNVSKASYHLSSLRDRKLNRDWDFNHCLELLEKYQIQSTFYFLALEPGEQDFNYRLEWVKEDLKRLEEAGHEIGLHGGHLAFNDLEKMSEEKQKLQLLTKQTIQGYRSHFLNLEIPRTWEILQGLGFRYDHSLGYSREIGFRNGMCYPFRPFHPPSKSWMNVFVMPLMIMDVALLLRKNLSYAEALEESRLLLKEVARLGGVCSVLWHNNYMQGKERRLFEDILRIVKDLDAWTPSTRKFLEWWTQEELDKEVEGIMENHMLKYVE